MVLKGLPSVPGLLSSPVDVERTPGAQRYVLVQSGDSTGNGVCARHAVHVTVQHPHFIFGARRQPDYAATPLAAERVLDSDSLAFGGQLNVLQHITPVRCQIVTCSPLDGADLPILQGHRVVPIVIAREIGVDADTLECWGQGKRTYTGGITLSKRGMRYYECEA